MEYQFRDIEKKWQEHWKKRGIYTVSNDSAKPKCYVLDMFPYPSGAGLHVGHPLGYIASDIYSRYKRLKGFNVLHPMGFDSFGLPAEQYALDTGQHPAETTKKNIATFKAQLDNIGFSYDWSREVQTSDPAYYRWTQWIFLKLFGSYYDRQQDKARPLEELVAVFEKQGNKEHPMPNPNFLPANFTASEWKASDEKQQQDILMQYRLAYCGIGEVNWCEALGTVLANDEVINGVSERGGYPVVKRKLRQWYLRITEYADRLLEGLNKVSFSDAMKEMQTNWIGKSVGAEIEFEIKGSEDTALILQHFDHASEGLTPNPSPKGEGGKESPGRNEDNSISPTQHSDHASEGLTPNPSPKGEGGKESPGTNEENSNSPTQNSDHANEGLTPNPSPKGEGGKESPNIKTANKKSWKILKEYAKENRKGSTEAEQILWNRIRDNKLGIKARRQHAIGDFIADFVFLEINLVVEVDGTYHNEKEQEEYDLARTDFLNEFGYKVLRFTNRQVLNDPENVVNEIQNYILKYDKERPLLLQEKGEGDEALPANLKTVSVGDAKEGGDLEGASLRVFTTRPDTIYGVDFMVISPEHELVPVITTSAHQKEVEDYLAYVASRSERERMAEKKITGVFTGAYAINPVSGKSIPVWISEYVLAGYGTGAIMAVPCGDERDHKFAKHFDLPITNIIGSYYDGVEANPTKDAKLENSDFLNGIEMRKAAEIVLNHLELIGKGTRKVNYKMRDAAFSRQRYWGEPFPIKWKNGIAVPLSEKELPLRLPHVDSYKAGPDGEGPLANISSWTSEDLETNTMPGYAGSSWYFLRYMDPHNQQEFCSRKAVDYWNQVDLYIGGTEHAVGHLLYSRMWTKVLFDLGLIGHDEPYKKLVNQGMIQGSSRFVYRIHGTNDFVSAGLKASYDVDAIHVDVNMVDGVELDMKAFREWKPEYKDARFICEDGSFDAIGSPSSGKYICGAEVEKMSKSKFNTVNPDHLVAKYGADTFRMYEMFLGPVEMSKPWDTKGIEGVHRFLKKFWRLYADESKGIILIDEAPTPAELKALHTAIRKIENDTERFSFNTGVSSFMIVTNELTDLKCHKRAILEPLLVLLAPYAPHVAEELWHLAGKEGSILDAGYPVFEDRFVKETSKEYPVSVNGKTRTTIEIALDAMQQEVEEIVLNNEVIKKWLEGRPPKKIIFVKGKMVNVVV